MFYSKTTNKVWLEANTERSESNPGRSLGTISYSSPSVWKTVPRFCLRFVGSNYALCIMNYELSNA